jgi:hypothetical protein
MANIIYYYKNCASNGCTAPSNGTFAFCTPCYQARIASQRPCNNCKSTMVDIPQSDRLFPKCNLKKVYCTQCTQAYHIRLLQERRIEQERLDKEHREYIRRRNERIEQDRLEKIRLEQDRLEKIRLEEERQKDVIRVALSTPDSMVDYIFDMTKKFEALMKQNEVLTKRLDELKPSEDSEDY